ncbi:uncharacterized protein IL334_002411 [Kwoniella shivajii]|uniref:Dienelactone hydrolase domain-containing protein n=1 Tax=Kwoniella shivajii TaxID=564305 RepID=A0ABZ1CUN5_9TREE|nr:hypothetical protein IL334_002411 [Kwoniella shivajii]
MSGDCCRLPPVQAEYTAKGTYTTIGDLKTYAVGPEDAKIAVVIVYDIFGFSPQATQGADLLASQGYRVLLPDFLLGKYADGAMFAPGGEEKRAKFFSAFPGAISTQYEPLAKFVQSIREPGTFEKVAAVGCCWGYKVVAGSNKNAGVDAIIGTSPSFAAPEDAENINVPLLLLPSGGEDMEVMSAIIKSVDQKNPGKNFLKHYSDMPHGWMAARGDLSGGKATDAYADGYNVVAKFIKDTF